MSYENSLFGTGGIFEPVMMSQIHWRNLKSSWINLVSSNATWIVDLDRKTVVTVGFYVSSYAYRNLTSMPFYRSPPPHLPALLLFKPFRPQASAPSVSNRRLSDSHRANKMPNSLPASSISHRDLYRRYYRLLLGPLRKYYAHMFLFRETLSWHLHCLNIHPAWTSIKFTV